MLTPYAFQRKAIEAAVGRKSVLVDARLGAGKTLVGAEWLRRLHELYRIQRQLIIAPRRVLDFGWRPLLETQCPGAAVLDVKELEDLQHEAPGDWAIALMSNRALKNGLRNVNRSGVGAVVIDEPTTVLTGINARRLRAWLKRDKPEFRLALSATPWAGGLESLWALYALVHEDGEPFGYRSQTQYMDETHIDKAPRHLNFPIWRPRKGMEKRLMKQSAPMTLTMVPDFKEVPSTTSDRHFILRGDAKDDYAKMRKSITTDDGVPAAGGVKVLMMRRRLQKAKHQALKPFFAELFEPCLIWCEFVADRAAIHKAAAAANLESADVGSKGAIDAWNARSLDVLVANPAEAGHGLNLQKGGRLMLWFTLPWSLELYDQAVGRLKRHGQKETVHVIHWTVKNTVEDAVREALRERRNVVRAWRAYFKEKGA